MSTVDFGSAASDYAAFRKGFPPAMFDRLAAFGVGLAGQRILDVGAGTGAVARPLAARGAVVTALDPSLALLAQAREMAAAEGVVLTTHQGTAEHLGLSDIFDVVTAAQCWHWFDGEAAAREIYAHLRPGGVLVVLHFDWVRLPGNVVDVSMGEIEVFREHRPSAVANKADPYGVYGRWFPDLAGAGFVNLESFSFDEDVPYSQAGWRGRIRASADVGASRSAPDVERFDRAHAKALTARYGGADLKVPHRCFAIVARRPE